jgi:hypothetical protein
MLKIGNQNRLQVVKEVPFGVYLDAGELGTILLPGRYVPKACAIDDWLDVFVYADSEDLLIATTLTPKAVVGECAYLKVVAVNETGAFLDWGLPKDLLVPFTQQQRPMEVGRSYVVYLYLDETNQRIAAASKLSNYLAEESDGFKPWQAVDLLIAGRSDLGYKAVIAGTHLGLIFASEVFQPLKMGQQVQGYIKAIREDGKIDLCLGLPGKASRDSLAERILDHLKAHGVISRLTDKSPPEAIYHTFGVSKAKYKKALGGLYKEKRILIEKQQITLLKP